MNSCPGDSPTSVPELPEVECIRRRLAFLLPGRRLSSASSLLPNLVRPSGRSLSLLAGRQVQSIERRGKILVIEFSENWSLLVHLRMTGRFLYQRCELDYGLHTHALFELETGDRLLFQDPRRFGSMDLVPSDRRNDVPPLSSLGPEPLDIDAVDFAQRVRRRRAIKDVLLDQSVVAGLGNIYSAEALFRSGISPLARACDLESKRIEALHQATCEVLAEAIAMSENEAEGLIIDGLFGGERWKGWLKVYGKEGQPCSRCGSQIVRVAQAGRSTWYCPGCQTAD